MTTKSLTNVRIKDADQGLVTAVISTFGVIDRDGDVTSKSTFTEGASVIVSAYGHRSWDGQLPLGKGTISTTDSECLADVQFFLNTPHGRAAFDTIKELGDLQQWSYSLENTVARKATHSSGRVANFIDSTDVTEVSPVLKGASIDTRTLEVKAASKQLNSQVTRSLDDAGTERWGSETQYVWLVDFDVEESFAVYCISADDAASFYVQVAFTRDDSGAVTLGDDELEVERVITYASKATFSEHAKSVLAGVRSLTARASEVVALRAEKGKTISDQSKELLGTVEAELAAIKALIEDPTPDTFCDVLLEIELGAIARRQGVTL